jgi:hypothetical protein
MVVTKSISSFEDLHQLVLGNQHAHFIYRGESGSEYALRPKYGRDKSSIRDDALAIERGLLTEFKRRGAPHVDTAPSSEWEWLAVAQHFGLATRLLDWSENPLVAAYFATCKLGRTDRVVYSLNRKALSYANEDISPFMLEEPVIYEPKHIATRIMAQTGLFTVHHKPSETFAPKELERWVIAGPAVLSIHVSLNRYGFNPASMFPGLDGLAEHVNMWHLRGNRDEGA